MKIDKIYIGTSGWAYKHWQEVFYPEDLKSQEMLSFYSQYFQTVEINSSFYHLPRKTTFNNWQEKVPDNFLFAVKVWRRITHLKKLKDIKEDLEVFFERVTALGEKLGPLLFQFPPSFQATKINVERLEKLIQSVYKYPWPSLCKFTKRHYALEFRHPSWFSELIYSILKKYNFALCWADTPNYPYKEVITADYVYIRLHGHEQLYASKYTKKQLSDYAKKIRKIANEGKTVYVYFDNDAYGYAIQNALELKEMLKK